MTAADRYAKSNELHARALRSIPLGAQTFSKSAQQFPAGGAPLFIASGSGGRCRDVDNNEYVDLIGGLLPVVLGHGDPDVTAAIHAQLENGIVFSTGSPLEIELAERLIEIIPCAERVRFGKNGSDATTAAVRLARAHTGRDRIIACGYHGWQDWYIGATVRHKGVPEAVRALTTRVAFNNLDAMAAAFGAHPGEVAAVIMEPVGAVEPSPGYFEAVTALAHKEGALLIFDEIISGFRVALGGAQQYFGVTPDLACFGKAMGNGMPISAVVGRAEIMMQMEEIFFSATFAGETLSIAAAIAVIDKMRRAPVIETLWQRGAELVDGARQRIHEAGLSHAIHLDGLAPWTLIGFADHPMARKEAIRTLFLREMIACGVLVAASHNVSYAHDDADIAQVLAAYDKVCPLVAEELATGKLEERLGIAPITPVFSVRAG